MPDMGGMGGMGGMGHVIARCFKGLQRPLTPLKKPRKHLWGFFMAVQI
jgi:hypothetical protein